MIFIDYCIFYDVWCTCLHHYYKHSWPGAKLEPLPAVTRRHLAPHDAHIRRPRRMPGTLTMLEVCPRNDDQTWLINTNHDYQHDHVLHVFSENVHVRIYLHDVLHYQWTAQLQVLVTAQAHGLSWGTMSPNEGPFSGSTWIGTRDLI